MNKRINARGFLLSLLLSMAVTISGMAASASPSVADLLARSGLSFSPVKGRTDSWSITYSGLNNLEELWVYVLAHEANYVTVYTTVFSIKGNPPKAFLWRLLTRNDEMLPFKYVIREDPDHKGTYLVDCQADLLLKSITADELLAILNRFVLIVDEDYPELKDLL